MEFVTIKSYQNGLALHIKEGAFQDILDEIITKFQSSRQFFGNTKLALSLSGMQLTPLEEAQIVDAIHLNSDLKIISLIGRDDDLDVLFNQTMDEYLYRNPVQEAVLPRASIYHGTLRTGQELMVNETLLVLGDINHGAKVDAGGDVIVLGSLLGIVHAGKNSDEAHFVAALEMAPDKLRIGDVKYKKKPEKRFWPDSNKNAPKIAALQDQEIVMQPITKETLGEILANRKI